MCSFGRCGIGHLRGENQNPGDLKVQSNISSGLQSVVTILLSSSILIICVLSLHQSVDFKVKVISRPDGSRDMLLSRTIRNPRVSPNIHFLHIAVAIIKSNLYFHIFTLSGVHMIHASPVHTPVCLLAERRHSFKLRIERLTCKQTCCPSPSGQEERVQERQDPPAELQGGRVDPSRPG